MKSNTKSWLIAIALLIIVGIITFTIVMNIRFKRIHKPVFEFPTTVVAMNTTIVPYLDTIALVMLNKVMKFDTIKVIILNMPDIDFEDGVLSAYVDKDPQVLHQYWLHVNPDVARDHALLMIAHECVHIQQCEAGRLIKLSPDMAKFDKDTIWFDKVPYMQRKYEIEAYKIQSSYEKILNKLIYHK